MQRGQQPLQVDALAVPLARALGFFEAGRGRRARSAAEETVAHAAWVGEELIEQHVELLLEEEGAFRLDARAAVEDEHTARELRRAEAEVRMADEEAGDGG